MSEIGINEMVRRRVDYNSVVRTRRIIYAHRIYGHRSRQGHFSPGWMGKAKPDPAAKEILTRAVAGLDSQLARVVNRSGGMRGIALFGDGAAAAGTRGAADPGTVRPERLP